MITAVLVVGLAVGVTAPAAARLSQAAIVAAPAPEIITPTPRIISLAIPDDATATSPPARQDPTSKAQSDALAGCLEKPRSAMAGNRPAMPDCTAKQLCKMITSPNCCGCPVGRQDITGLTIRAYTSALFFSFGTRDKRSRLPFSLLKPPRD
tara:strand:- start:10395 stop:10850 length:456 start_codon:yes stop_codon:yes gene_type:complete